MCSWSVTEADIDDFIKDVKFSAKGTNVPPGQLASRTNPQD
jgi:hypothetical protein